MATKLAQACGLNTGQVQLKNEGFYMNTKPIEICSYNPHWPKQFEIEANQIKQALGIHCKEIHHIGSTSIPGLSAKPDIDILCVVNDLKPSLQLQSIGYIFKGELNIPLRYYFSKNTDFSKVNLHVAQPDHGFIQLNLAFRDYLRSHEEDKNAYSNLKYDLLKDPESFKRTHHGFPFYTLKKNAFIKNILQKAKYQGLMVNLCAHEEEWEQAKGFNPHLDPSCNQHLVLYKGVNIVGYAEINPEKAIQNLVIHENNENLRPYFKNFIDLWCAS